MNPSSETKREKRKTTDQQSGAKKKSKTPKAWMFYLQAHALDYIKKHGGLIFSRDVPKKIGAKLFFVLPSIDDIYDFIFIHPKIDRYFYEFLLPNKPSKLTFDLDLPRDKLKDGEDLVKTMDAMEKEFTGVVVQLLQEKHGINVENILSLNSDSLFGDKNDKGSRHVHFPDVWFDCFATSMKAFIQGDVQNALSESTMRCFDYTVYTKHRSFRFLGNRKECKKAYLHLANHDLQPFTPEHRDIFDRAWVQASPPADCVPIHIDVPAPVQRTSNLPRRAYNGTSDTCELMDKAKRLGYLKDKFKKGLPTKDGQGVYYTATTVPWTCANGATHRHNRTIAL